MPQQTAETVPAVDFDDVIAKFSPQDRTNINRHLEACEGEATRDHVKLWKRMVSVLASIASHAARTTQQIAVQFFVADGKHRLQVFAIEDHRDGTIQLYMPDAMATAVESGLLLEAPAPVEGNVRLYPIAAEPASTLKIETLSAAKTVSAPEYFKHMLGWNRKAIRVTLPITATPAQIHTVEVLCVLSARVLGVGQVPA